MSIIEQAKAHPYIASAGVLVIGVVFYMLFNRGGGTSAPAGVDMSNSVATGDALQSAMLQAQSATAQGQLALQAQAEHDATALKVAELQTNAAAASDILGYNLARFQTQSNENIILGQSTIAAGVENTKTNTAATVNLATIKAFSDQAIAQAALNERALAVSEHIADTQATIATSAISADVEKYIAGLQTSQVIAAQQNQVNQMLADNARPRSFLESIFG